MDKPSKIRLETSNELKHQRAKLKEKLLRMEEQYDAAKRCMEEGESIARVRVDVGERGHKRTSWRELTRDNFR